jgi:thiamine biosynthesis lipoprotein
MSALPFLLLPARFAAVIAGVLMAGLVSCGPPPPHLERVEGRTMGTTWSLQVVQTGDRLAPAPAAPAALVQSRLDELEALFTNWSPTSPVSQFNQSTTTDWQTAPRELAEVATLALELSEATHGAFDITLGPLVDLWGFGPAGRRDSPPDQAAIDQARARCGWQRLEASTNPPRLRKTHPGIQINVSALVEGYAADEIARRLEEAGFHHFLLDIGGELLARGTKADGTPWQAGIQRPSPTSAQGDSMLALPLPNRALSTSGTYRQYFESGGQRYAHVLDGRTGRPIDHGTTSVSVLADTCLEADAWATALLALGPEEGSRLAQKRGLQAFFLAVP